MLVGRSGTHGPAQISTKWTQPRLHLADGLRQGLAVARPTSNGVSDIDEKLPRKPGIYSVRVLDIATWLTILIAIDGCALCFVVCSGSLSLP